MLVKGYEKRGGYHYSQVYDIPSDKDWALETFKFTMTIGDTRVEMG